MLDLDQPALVINDGTLPGLVAAWTVGSVRGGDSGASASLNWFPETVPSAGSASASRWAAVERQVTLCGLSGAAGSGVLTLGVAAKAAMTDMLISAAAAAAEAGLGRVIWPIHAGPNPELDLDALADICDRALLVSQLATIDLPRAVSGNSLRAIKIETPYADFTDAELLELALDLDAPLGACWWCRSESSTESQSPCGACAECVRWRQALAAIDPQNLLDAESLWGAAQAV